MVRTSEVRVTEIMTDMRKTHSVGVSFHTAWNEKKKGHSDQRLHDGSNQIYLLPAVEVKDG